MMRLISFASFFVYWWSVSTFTHMIATIAPNAGIYLSHWMNQTCLVLSLFSSLISTRARIKIETHAPSKSISFLQSLQINAKASIRQCRIIPIASGLRAEGGLLPDNPPNSIKFIHSRTAILPRPRTNIHTQINQKTGLDYSSDLPP